MTKTANPKLLLGLLPIRVAFCRTVTAQSTTPTNFPGPPAYKTVRYKEDYRYLRDQSKRADSFDSIK